MSQNVAAQVAPEPPAPPEIRKFYLSDLAGDGQWLLPRLMAAHPHLDERFVGGWMRALVSNNEFLFLRSDNACALFQVQPAPTLVPSSLVLERFVWARDPKNQGHLAEAARMYGEMAQWARAQRIDIAVVGELTDVPGELMKKHLGRISERKQMFARLA